MKVTDNYKKHTHRNPIQKFLINNFHKNLIDTVKKSDPESILDVGCGEGFVLELLQKEEMGKKFEGIDFSKAAIEIGKKINPYLNLKQGDIYKLPYKDNSFDLVICTEVLEHLENPEKALKELKRVSKKFCILSVPNEPIFRLANFLRGKNLKRWGNDIDHINHWSSYNFANFISNDFKVLEIKRPFPWTMVLVEAI